MNSHVLTRRHFLGTAGAVGLGTAASWGLAASDQDRGPKGPPIKVGILHSLSGFLAISETALKNAEMLALGEINARDGVLGKKVEAIVEDPESNFTEKFPEKAKKLLLVDKVAAVFGCWTSASRKNILPLFEENNSLLFYPVAYEGNESSRNVVYTGALPNQQALPAVDWLRSKEGGAKKKFYLLGSDYIFPRMVGYLVTQHLKTKGLQPVAQKFVPLGEKDFPKVVQDIRQQKADVVLSTLVGDSNIPFFAEMAAQGLTAAKVPVLSLSLDEEDLRDLDPKKVQGHLAAWPYFQSVATERNRAFVKAFQAKYGKDRVTSAAIEAAYTQVYLWKAAVEKAKSTATDKVRKALAGLELEAPGGKIKVDARNQHTWKRFRIGRINKDRQFDLVYEAKDWVPPDPYPPPLKRPTRD